MKWFARYLVSLIACASTYVCMARGIGPVCGLDCRVPTTLCPAEGTNNTFCANAWNSDGKGYQCLEVGDDQRSFVATSHWTSLPAHVVHSYPHIKLGSPLFPRQFRDIASLRVNAEWGMGRSAGPKIATSLAVDSDGLTKSQCIANVAFDIWADLDPVLASNESMARIEIMLWLGVFGPVQPLGWDNKTSRTRPQLRLGDNNFTLFEGSASVGRSTFTWMPDTNYTHISQDLSPLVQYLWKNNLVPAEAYVGTVGFGSESFFSLDPIAFTAQSLSLNVTSEGVAPFSPCDSPAGKNQPLRLLSFLFSFATPMIAYSLS
ncbi:concanavalin A-like lectin/glucanase domain-containing protein [Schizothecium vesticola]|uniref:Concanavalin A-like lectin/glucanase domain-containing protein n=1 Tax=Schizothecium vesticola TaxID=314040 RepID=A0AA40EJ79_9PEZI|nr:concanavalin A-like lectin/glucanase domain-containing protein [Schizothecium vesticola]